MMGLLSGRVFFLITIFSFIATLMYYVGRFLPIILLGHTSEHLTAIFVQIFNTYTFLLSPILLFIVFYYVCGKIIQEKPASAIISLIIGDFTGTWIGGLAATLLLIKMMPENFTFIDGLSQLSSIMPQNLMVILVLAVAAMLSSWFALKWDEKLAETGFQARAQPPTDVTLVSLLYLAHGILSLCILPLAGLALSIMGSEINLPLFAALIPLILVNVGAQIAIAIGLYRGKRWGWILAFIAALTGTCIQINSAIIYFQHLGLFALTITALALNIMALMLLLTRSSRQYCRIINPTKTEA